jgi:hypothetical protein
LFLALLPMVSGCGNQVELNPALVPQQEDIDQGTAAGKALIAAGADPYQAFSRLMQDINIRVSADVVIRQAAVCWPRAEIAFEIAEQGDASDTGIQKAVTEALFRLRSELRFVVVVQIPDARDPASVGFEMRALSTSYPPVAVEKPVLIRAVSSALDPDMPPSSLWSYDVSFPISGSPGYPPIDTNTTFVTLVVKDGEAEGDITVTFPQRRTPTV